MSKITRPTQTPLPGKDLYNAVRGALVSDGSSLKRWSEENGMTRQWVSQCLLGSASGSAADAVIAKIYDAYLNVIAKKQNTERGSRHGHRT